MSMFGGAAGSAPQPPKFKPVKLGQANKLATKYDTLGFNLSDQDFLSRFPGLVAIRDSELSDAVDQVINPLDPTVETSFVDKATSSTLGAFGGSGGSVGEAGSAARGSIAASIASQTQSKQDYDRLQLQNLIQMNPERQFGLSGGDLVNLMIGNTTGKNQAAYQAYQAQVGNANAASAAGAAGTQSAIQLGVSLVGLAVAI